MFPPIGAAGKSKRWRDEVIITFFCKLVWTCEKKGTFDGQDRKKEKKMALEMTTKNISFEM